MMSLEAVLHELIGLLGKQGDLTLPWELMEEWPPGALAVLEEAGWIQPAAPATTVECPGCPDSCFMPVHVFPSINGRPPRAFVACDYRDDIGRVGIPLERLRQWQISVGGIAAWVTHSLGLKNTPEWVQAAKRFKLGSMKGKKRLTLLELDYSETPCLRCSGHSQALVELIRVETGEFVLDQNAVNDLVNLPTASAGVKTYKPSIVRREARKLETQALHERWKKAYQTLKRENPGKTEGWYANKIAKMEIAKGRKSGTIKKNMMPDK